MKFVLDASAVLAFVKGERGAETVREILYLRGDCCIHPVNWIEIHYKIWSVSDSLAADAAIGFLADVGVVVQEVSGDDYRRRVSSIKILHPKLSLGDCHAVALAESIGGTVVTSDKMFSEAEALVSVLQIR